MSSILQLTFLYALRISFPVMSSSGSIMMTFVPYQYRKKMYVFPCWMYWGYVHYGQCKPVMVCLSVPHLQMQVFFPSCASYCCFFLFNTLLKSIWLSIFTLLVYVTPCICLAVVKIFSDRVHSESWPWLEVPFLLLWSMLFSLDWILLHVDILPSQFDFSCGIQCWLDVASLYPFVDCWVISGVFFIDLLYGPLLQLWSYFHFSGYVLIFCWAFPGTPNQIFFQWVLICCM